MTEQPKNLTANADDFMWMLRDDSYSIERMRRKLEDIAAAENLPQTARAIDFAATAHAGQLRKPSVFHVKHAGGSQDSDSQAADAQVPYIFHPFSMALHAHALGIRDDAALACTLLHDVCEDCGVSPDQLPFSNEVREAVALLTKPASGNYSTDAYYAAISENATAALVKTLDRCNNVSAMMLSFSLERVAAYIDETERYILPLFDAIEELRPEYSEAAFAIKYHIHAVVGSIKAAMARV